MPLRNPSRVRCLLAAAFLVLAAGCRPPDEGRVVRFLEAPDTGGGWREIIARFETAHPDIRVELVEGPASTNTREEMYTAAFLAGDSTYDIAYMDVVWVAKFASRGWLLPLDDRFPGTDRASFLPGDIAASMYDGLVYRVPMQADAGMLYYRADLVSRPPETFDELVASAQRVQDPPDQYGFVFQGLQYEGLVCNFLEVLWGFGGDVLDATGAVVLDHPEGVQALEWMVGLVGTISPDGVTTYQEEETRHAFQEGRALFMRNWPYAWTKLQEPGSSVKGLVGIRTMVHAPGQESAATLGGWGFGVSATTRDVDAAWRFIEFATRTEQQKVLHLRNGRIPTRRTLFQDPDVLAASPHYPELYEILLAARPRPVHPRYAEISDAIQAHVSAALVGKASPADAVASAAAQIRTIVGS